MGSAGGHHCNGCGVFVIHPGVWDEGRFVEAAAWDGIKLCGACRCSLEASMAAAMLFKACRGVLPDLVNRGGDRRCSAVVNGVRCVKNAEHAVFGDAHASKYVEPR